MLDGGNFPFAPQVLNRLIRLPLAHRIGHSGPNPTRFFAQVLPKIFHPATCHAPLVYNRPALLGKYASALNWTMA